MKPNPIQMSHWPGKKCLEFHMHVPWKTNVVLQILALSFFSPKRDVA